MWTFSQKLRFLEKCFGRAYIAANQKNVELRCPWCDPKDPTKKKLSIRISDDAYNCWRCGERGRSLLFLLKNFAPEHLNEYVETFAPHLKDQSMIIDPVIPAFKLPNDFTLLATNTRSRDPDVKAVLNYLSSRDVSEHDMWFRKIGTSNEGKWRRRALFPSFDVEGNLNFMVGRSVDQRNMPKYETPPIERRSIVFDEINVDWKKQVILCEGVFDALKCGENAIPLLGSSLNENSLLFERIVMNMTPVIVLLDADMIESSAPRLTRKLSQYQIDAKIVNLKELNRTDPGSMTKQEVQDAVGTARTLDWFSYTIARLDRMARVSL